MNLTPADIKTIAAAAAVEAGTPDLADSIKTIPENTVADALKAFEADSTDDYAAGREAAKNYKP